MLEDVEGALFSQSNIDKNTIQLNQLPLLSRIAVATGPAVSSTENGDETGIVAGGLGDNVGSIFWTM